MKKQDVDRMTLQEACDYSVSKIVEQGGTCMNSENSCLYKHGDSHCAIGWLLDEDSDVLMNFKGSVKRLTENERVSKKLPKLIKENLKEFTLLQYLHDAESSYRRESMLEDLERMGVSTSAHQYQEWVEMGCKANCE